MKDGLQGISFDRVLMRIKDITSIICNIITMLTAIGAALWISFKFIENQNETQRILTEALTRTTPQHVNFEKLMPEWIQLGRRRSDIALVVDFHRKILLVRANTAWIDAIDLEVIPSGTNDYAPGMVLTKRYWKNLYLMIEREGWNEEDYVQFARKRFKEQGIKRP